MAIRVASTVRRCAHPQCQDTIPAGEAYQTIEREPYHLECARIRLDEIAARQNKET